VIEIAVAGRPAPKGSRIAGRTKDGRTYTRAASKYEEPWVEAVKTRTQIVMRHHRTPAPPYAVRLDFHLKKSQHRRKDAPEYPTVGDLDKLARAVIDGLVKGGAMEDDKHVTVLTASKRFAESDETTGVVAEIRSLAPARQTAVA
jgi:Holliday junction resolvase RusA-like endonuclease